MTLKALGKNLAGANIQYIRTLLRGEALRQFDTLSADVGSDTPEKCMSIILGLGTYFFLLMCCQSKNVGCAADRGIRAVQK